MKHIFSYTDYRGYLRDFYSERKQNSKFTYREFSRLAGFSSPVFIKLVIENKSNLRKSSIPKITKALGLKKAERMYFKNLVLFNQAANVDDKVLHLNEMKKHAGTVKTHELNDKQFSYYSKWYHSVIREILNLKSFPNDFEAISKAILPPLTKTQVQESISLLKKLGLVRADKQRKLKVTTKFVSSKGLQTSAVAVRGFQKKMASLAADAIDNVPKEDRNISGMTLGLSPSGFIKASEEMERCRKRLMELADKDKGSDRVYRANLQFFPLTQSLKEQRPKKRKSKPGRVK